VLPKPAWLAAMAARGVPRMKNPEDMLTQAQTRPAARCPAARP